MMDQPALSRRLCAEGFGTFCLVFAGTGAVIVNEVTEGAVTHVGVALTFGLVVMALVYTLGKVSGCHLNPAVTLGLCVAGRASRTLVMPYIVSQCVGALLASGTLRVLFPASSALGATVPAGSDGQSFVLEFVLTLILMFVILSTAFGGSEEKLLAGAAIGGVVGFEALFAGPISGASMNPARSLAPAIVALQLDHVWIYVVAPIAGALASVPLSRWIHASPSCCPADLGGNP